jgi:hypothetical protein
MGNPDLIARRHSHPISLITSTKYVVRFPKNTGVALAVCMGWFAVILPATAQLWTKTGAPSTEIWRHRDAIKAAESVVLHFLGLKQGVKHLASRHGERWGRLANRRKMPVRDLDT